MQKALRNIAFILPLIGCGAAKQQESAELSSVSSASRREAVIVEGSLNVTPVNPGINPMAFGLRVSAKVMLGANPCAARGVNAGFENQTIGPKIFLTPMLTLPPDAGSRICTMEYRPVYADISTDVRGLRGQVSDVFVKNVGSLGNDVSILERRPGPVVPALPQATVLSDAKASVINGGFNPDAFAYQLSGRVMLGANPCSARGVTASLSERIVGGTLYVTAVLNRPQGTVRPCTFEYNPVYAPVSTVLRGFNSQVSSVVVENVQTMGTEVSINDLLQ